MTKPATLGLTLLAAATLCVGYGIVRGCTAGAIASAQDRCLEPPACSYTMYFLDSGLWVPAVGAVCETCSTYYQGCDLADTNTLATNALWAQFYKAAYYSSTNVCGVPKEDGLPRCVSLEMTNHQTLESGCGELSAPTAGRPVQRPIFINPQP
jgi:hypothetical protein